MSLFQRVALGLGSVALPYLWARLGRLLSASEDAAAYSGYGHPGDAGASYSGNSYSERGELEEEDSGGWGRSAAEASTSGRGAAAAQSRGSGSLLGAALRMVPWRRVLRGAETVYHLAAFANLLAFLRYGKYRCARAAASSA